MQIIFKQDLIEKVKTGKVIHKIVRILPAKGIAKLDKFEFTDESGEVFGLGLILGVDGINLYPSEKKCRICKWTFDKMSDYTLYGSDLRLFVEHEGFSSLDDFWEVYQKPFYGWLLNFYLYREKK
jgi:hypothetical protein